MSTPLVFPYMPHGEEDFVEGPGYATEILAGYSTREQRIAQRGLPGGRIEMVVRALEAVEATEILGLLFANQAGLWQVPLWPFALPITADLSGGETFLPIEPPVAGYGLEVVPWVERPQQSGAVLLYRNDRTWQLLKYEAIATESGWGEDWGESWGAAVSASPSGLHVATAVQGFGTGWGLGWGEDWGDAEDGGVAWPAGTLVIPLRLARLDQETADSLESLDAATGRLGFVIEEAA